MSLTAYLSPSLLSGLSDVSVSPGVGINNYPLIWNNTQGKWTAALLPTASISGLGSMATQNSGSVVITGGNVSGLTTLSASREGNNTDIIAYCYTSNFFFQAPRFFGYRARGTAAAPEGVLNGDWIFYFAGLNRGTTGWASQGTGFSITAKANASDYVGENRVPTGYLFQVMNATPTIVNCFEADSTGLRVLTNTPSTSSSSGALRVVGGFGCTGAAWISGGIVGTGARVGFPNLPTSDVGLTTGDLWRDGNTVKIKV